MDICLVIEGSYPYIVGGVSSWSHTLIQSLPEHNFIVVTLYPSVADKGAFKYDLPDNVTEIREIFLDEMADKVGKFKSRYQVNKKELEELNNVLGGEDADWDSLISFFSKNKDKSPQDFLMSKTFYDTMIQTYDMGYSHVALSEFFWSIRSMILPLIGIMSIDMPKADLYHTVSTGYAGIMAVVGKKQHNARMILTEHGIYTREREEEIIGANWVPTHFKDMWIKYFHNLSRCAYKYTDRAITLFEDAKTIQSDIGCDPDKQMIIENGVHANEFWDLPRKELNNGGINLGAVVRVVPIKDILTMLQAFRVIKNEIDDITLYVMGPYDESKEYYDECIAVTNLLGLSDSVIFTGRIHVKEYMPKIDVMMLSSISEGQPLTILESLSMGIPFVSTNVGSCREVIMGTKDNFGPAGIVVPVMDYNKLAKAVIKIIRNKELHESMSKAGRNRLKTKYSTRQLINSYRQLYAEME